MSWRPTRLGVNYLRSLASLFLLGLTGLGVIAAWRHRLRRRREELRPNEMATDLKTFAELAELFRSSNAPIVVVDAQGVVVDWNEKASQLIGIAKREVIGRKLTDFVVDEDRVGLTENLEAIVTSSSGTETGQSGFFHSNITIVTSDEKRRDVVIHASPTKGDGDAPLALCVLQAHRATIPITNVDLHDNSESARAYFDYIKGMTGVHATTSCYSAWSQSKESNGCAKVVPVLSDASYQTFFFDDNIEFDSGGSADSLGICNLRDEDGRFVDFRVGTNGFVHEKFMESTDIVFSRERNVVLVAASILEAMCDDDYFTNIVARFSQPGQKNIMMMDINSTVVFGDIIGGKDKESVLLSTMFGCMFVNSSEEFEFTWGSSTTKVAAGKVMLKKVVKKALDKESYRTFYNYANCRSAVEILCDKGTVLYGERSIEVTDFEKIFEEYSRLLSATVKDGIVKSWFELVKKYKNDHLLMLNTFGVDSRMLILETVEDEDDVRLFAVNYENWGSRDKEKFEEQYTKVPRMIAEDAAVKLGGLISAKARIDAKLALAPL